MVLVGVLKIWDQDFARRVASLANPMAWLPSVEQHTADGFTRLPMQDGNPEAKQLPPIGPAVHALPRSEAVSSCHALVGQVDCMADDPGKDIAQWIHW